MKNYSEQEQRERYQLLSPRLKEALSSTEILRNISNIGREFQLPEDKIEILAKISGLVFMGFLSINDLHKQIKDKLNINEETCDSLQKNLDQEIFLEYKDEIEEFSKSTKPISEIKPPFKKQEQPTEVKKTKEVEQERKIEIKEELLKKRGPDKYREEIETTEESKKAKTVKEGGKIKKIF